jgi:hypothetical protein
MPLDHDLHLSFVADRIDRLIARLDEPEEAVAEMVDYLYRMGYWPDVCTIPIEEAGNQLICGNPAVAQIFGTWGIAEALPAFRVFDMPGLREQLEYEMEDPPDALESWVSTLVSWPHDPGSTADEQAIQSAHLKLCAHPHHR